LVRSRSVTRSRPPRFIFVDRCEQNDEQNKKFNFCKGDYDSITTALNKVNWQTEFTGKSAEEMWIF